MKRIGICVAAAVLLALTPLTASAHILAMVNYESKTKEGLHAHGIKGHGDRKEGIAVIDVIRNPRPSARSWSTYPCRPIWSAITSSITGT